ncbi:hypothetical protein PIB30_046539 [Stylosanthes scabra]|uniref:Uncharacterized protein n=1 Tax=Stylosanthes scabra TaxID=79078 RepID=A0ABU6TG67_9FABA|nr:hypothetical protein [Stylosanthes scabra]
MAHLHASRVRAMALARPRGEYGHIRPKLHKCVACSRARTRALGTFGSTTGRVAHPRPSDHAPARAHPSWHVFGPPFDGAPARQPLRLRSESSLFFAHSQLNFSLLLQFSLNQNSHTHTPPLLHCFCVCHEGESKPPPMTPLPRGFDLLGTRAEGGMKVFRPTVLIINCTLTDGKGWKTGILCMRGLSAWMATKEECSRSAYSG